MTQDEKWQIQYEQMMRFMETNRRRPSKHRLEEHDMLNWFKSTKKRIAKGDYPQDRLEKFAILMEVADKYRRKNQYEEHNVPDPMCTDPMCIEEESGMRKAAEK